MAAGAFGAHGLTSQLRNDTQITRDEADRRLEIFDKAARYHMYHAIGVVLAGLVALRHPTGWLTVAGGLFIVGILVFSGCLYAMALGGPRRLGAVVPIGGVSFILGWVCLAVAAWRATND